MPSHTRHQFPFESHGQIHLDESRGLLQEVGHGHGWSTPYSGTWKSLEWQAFGEMIVYEARVPVQESFCSISRILCCPPRRISAFGTDTH
jgi:hypothetical protein